jgi:predicted RNase H-like HicB family nuclease
MKEMTNAQFDAFLETLAKLVEQAKTVEEAAEIVRKAKTKAE